MPSAEIIHVLRHAFRTKVNAVASALFAVGMIVLGISLLSRDRNFGLLVLGMSVLLVVAFVDAIIPCKVGLSSERIRCRAAFRWHQWDLSDVEDIRAEETQWLGMRVVLVVLYLRGGKRVPLEDTMCREEVSHSPGGALWAAEALKDEWQHLHAESVST